jgi:hypothetical protein
VQQSKQYNVQQQQQQQKAIMSNVTNTNHPNSDTSTKATNTNSTKPYDQCTLETRNKSQVNFHRVVFVYIQK